VNKNSGKRNFGNEQLKNSNKKCKLKASTKERISELKDRSFVKVSCVVIVGI
jgi:hypothetical protein